MESEKSLIKSILVSRLKQIDSVSDLEPFIKNLIVCLSDFVKSEDLIWKSNAMPQDLLPTDGKTFKSRVK